VSITSSEASFSSTEPVHSSDSDSSNWLFSFEIPWEKMPASLLKALKEGVAPCPYFRKQMMHIVVDKVMQVSGDC